MKRYLKLIFTLLLGVFVTSCGYREFADADYPENTIYQPLALDGILYISEPESDETLSPTPGSPKKFYMDEGQGKMIVNMGVVQSGIELKECSVELINDFSAVNKQIADETLELGTLPFPKEAVSFPSSLKISANSASVSYKLEIDLSLFHAEKYYGKKMAVAVRIYSNTKDIKVNEDLQTVVICVDPQFIYELN